MAITIVKSKTYILALRGDDDFIASSAEISAGRRELEEKL